MNLSLKTVPKWAWLSAGGLSVGIFAYRALHHNKAGEPVAAGTATDTPTGAYTGDPSLPGSAGAYPVYIAAPSGNASSVEVPTQPQDLPGLISSLGEFIGVLQPAPQEPFDYGGLSQLVTSLTGGGAPTNSTNPGGVNAPPIASPAAAPTPPAFTPTPPNPPSAPAPPPPAPDPCVGEFPNSGPHGCYKVVCASGKGDHAKGRWHFYKGGLEEHVAAAC